MANLKVGSVAAVPKGNASFKLGELATVPQGTPPPKTSAGQWVHVVRTAAEEKANKGPKVDLHVLVPKNSKGLNVGVGTMLSGLPFPAPKGTVWQRLGPLDYRLIADAAQKAPRSGWAPGK